MKNTIEKALQKKREQENTQVENTPQNEVVGQEIQQPAAKPNLMSSNVGYHHFRYYRRWS